ncbi:haloacid dehalogenase type II [Croceicoccus sediminis]|uniref:haloacid dehalogenase type II n=1 Tax=Croceicoccus sediminis TaxID=2571150 RepID=UPI00118349AB|nr:haloacid dehalogenase type II [Croceicoccus sediminis]
MFRPKYITFDCYGTIINFAMGPTAREVFADRVSAEEMDAFVESFRGYRLDEVLGAWKPFYDVVANAVARTCKKHGVTCTKEDFDVFYNAIPTWQPHSDAPGPLARVAEKIPLVILSNSMIDLIPHSVKNIGVPFHAALTAEEAQCYKPRMGAFEFMFDKLGCGPEDIMHVSSSPRYDLMTAYDLGIATKVMVTRGHEPKVDGYDLNFIKDFSELPGLVGL